MAGDSLGTQIIEGVNAAGTRHVSTIEAGAIGNDRPISITSETWYSDELKMAVMTKRSDPRTGEETFRLTNIQRGEPGAYLFQPPAGYQISPRPATASKCRSTGWLFQAGPRSLLVHNSPQKVPMNITYGYV